MLAGLVGRLFRVAARFTPGAEGRDLDHVGEELVRLERRPAQRPTTSR